MGKGLAETTLKLRCEGGDGLGLGRAGEERSKHSKLFCGAQKSDINATEAGVAGECSSEALEGTVGSGRRRTQMHFKCNGSDGWGVLRLDDKP